MEIELKNVGFIATDGTEILKNINLQIKNGEKIILEGPNGAGKSTLLKIIAGLLEPSSGKIFVNGISLQNIDLNYYRSLVGQSITEESPFEGSLLENLTFGDKDISQKEIFEVLENVGLSSFVRQQPKGLDTLIFPEGRQMAYTTSKKIVLARSILKKPKLLILNEPLNQVDEEEAARIIKYLFEDKHNWSLIVTSQDRSWRKYCNRRIRINNGEIENTV